MSREPITSSTRTTIGAAVIVCGALIGHAVWMAGVSADLKYIRVTMGEAWGTADMRLWAERLGRSNPELQLPDVDAIRRRP